MKAVRHLSRKDALAAGAADWNAALSDVRETLRLLGTGEAGMVAECAMPLGRDPRNKAYGLPAFVGGAYDAAGLKWTVHRAEPGADPADDQPSITSLTVVNRLSSGAPLGMVESALLTRMRTAAVSATAMRALKPDGIRSVALLGAGAQAETHLDMLLRLFPDLETIHVWNRTPAHLARMVAAFAEPVGPRLLLHDELDAALVEADVVLCCTSAPEPIVSSSAVRPGRLIMQVGFNEVAFDAIAASDLVAVDLWGAFAETSAKSLFQMYRAGRFDPSEVAADLPALVDGDWRPPPGASLYFSSFGLNVFDIAFAARLLRRAQELGVGTLLPAI